MPGRGIWTLAARQHGVVSRRQLLDRGLSRRAIEHRIRLRRLHPLRIGVYAVGRPGVTRRGELMAAVLACGEDAVLSHRSAGELWGLTAAPAPLEVTVAASRNPRPAGVAVHRRLLDPGGFALHDGIPVTGPLMTLIDLASVLERRWLEAAVNAADRVDLLDPDAIRDGLHAHRGRRGTAALRSVLDRQTFALTDSELERRFLPLARRAGLPRPETQVVLDGFRVDFFWRALGLVVETDGLRYHRTASQQARDRVRDQTHAATGLTTLRFTHSQVVREPRRVVQTLTAVARRLAERGD
ncbi:MAG: DUF559 domain-containing protein [Actinobacteria bacterium]|nr:DUF559 domain-containing protein [Actinomycetota bacterium]